MVKDLAKISVTRRNLLWYGGVGALAAAAVGVSPRLTSAAGFRTSQVATPGATPTAKGPTAPSWATTNDWATIGYDYENTRHVPFAQITADNLKQLGRVWSFDFIKADPTIPPENESFPLIVNGVLYVTTGLDHVFAFDAKTGKELWHWKPATLGFFKNFGLIVNRGVAYGEGKLYLLTLDMHIVAIDAKTGQTVKDVEVSSLVPSATADLGYYQTTMPIYYKGNLYFTPSGGDNGTRGFIMAAKASDLSPAWANPLWVVPPAGQGWRKEGNLHGGGNPWMPVTIDPETDILYVCTGNPSPDFSGAVRPGNNPNVDSLIAAKALTGEQLWVQQSISRDLWDYDMAASPVLMTATVDGERRKVVAEGSKAGEWWCYDAATGDLVYDAVAFSVISHPAPNAKGVLDYPGAGGGANYAPQSYDPTSNNYLICNIVSPTFDQEANPQQIAQRAPGDVDFGGTASTPEKITPYGTYVGISMDTGNIVYNIKRPGPLRSGFTTTATGLGFFGGTTPQDANLHAIDTKSGELLWSFGVGAGIMAAPSIYMIDGKEYVAHTVGDAGSSVSGLEVFALGGNTKQLTPVKVPSTIKPIPPRDEWLVAAPSKDTVIFNAVAALTTALGGMNFNGYGNGQMTLTVPVGWNLEINLWNHDAHLAHSIMITTQQELQKGSSFTPAFIGAFAPASPESGFIGRQVEPLQAILGVVPLPTAGTWIMLCAVPGHAAQGMWDYLKVSATAKVPTLTTPNGTIQMAKAAS